VLAAVALCAVAAVLLEVLNENLPQREQEGLETIIAVVAVAMVTSMIVWMARHARSIKGELETRAGVAIEGSVWAMVAMAFLAVLREGLETAVFLLSAFQASTNRGAASAGAVLGLVLAIAIGYGLYRGGVKINLAKFFTATGLVLVLVAAGLVAFAMHTGHEAGWIQFGQQHIVDLRWLIKPGSVQAALFTGVLGLQPRPVLIELVAWLAYLIPMSTFVLRRSRRKPAGTAPVPVTAATV
jgi:high-affinity iron transporter